MEQTQLGEKWFQAGILIVLMLFAVAVAFHYFVSVPKQIEQREEFESQRRADDEKLRSDLKSCFSEAGANYRINWQAECKDRKLGAFCALPDEVFRGLEKIQERDRQECALVYGRR